MTATAHALVGVTLAAGIPNPIIGFPVALLSHIICDLIPHWDSGTHYELKTKTLKRLYYEAIADVAISFIAVFLLLWFVFPTTHVIYAMSMAIAAQWLDWIAIPYLVYKWHFPPFSWAYAISHYTNTLLDKPWGIVTQVVTVLLLLAIVKGF